MKKLLVTGSSGLIGSELISYFSPLCEEIHGIDNNMRMTFFGPQGSTESNCDRLLGTYKNMKHHCIDIRDKEALQELFKQHQFDGILHCAAQPSHDLAAKIPFDDFEVNARGTLNLLEMTRQHCKDATFVFLSTNKVYGDRPNMLDLLELETRYEFKDEKYQNGIDENLSIDQCVHSLFGVSKVAADLLVQEYGKNFGLNTAVLRGGCLTGPNHAGVELHGFLNYLIKANVKQIPYTIFGYKGKQVRDNIHSYDVARAIHCILNRPCQGEVFNIGGGKENSCSLMEAVQKIELLSGKKMNLTYSEQNRTGDHICYYSSLNKLKSFYPEWNITRSLDTIFEEIYQSQL